MIPKIIHYCWLSGDTMPETYARCMETWKEKLKGYEFVLWDTKRFNIDSVLWVKQAFEVGLYACAADYIRLYAVYTTGGIYLDTDMESVRPFDQLLDADIMLAYENHRSYNIEAGCFGAQRGHPFIKKCMEYFETTPFFVPEKLPEIMKLDRSERHNFIDPIIAPELMRSVLEKYFLLENYKIYPNDYFTAKNVMTGEIEKTKNTFTVHHFGAQYHTDEWRAVREKEHGINKRFGQDSPISRFLIYALYFKNRARKEGFFGAVRYYFNKYFKRG
ncbi:MAG: glycosyl transferase [Spirochaetaceae bacterium]|jgi:mannosyltransferase OCH1-like enzyme|nr:glycosyl transferase [Spirochaetaceae bacterium]